MTAKLVASFLVSHYPWQPRFAKQKRFRRDCNGHVYWIKMEFLQRRELRLSFTPTPNESLNPTAEEGLFIMASSLSAAG
jgi:hypothetical protein